MKLETYLRVNKIPYLVNCYMHAMNITLDLPFLNIHNPFTNERINVYLDKHSRMSLDTKPYIVKQISHLSKGIIGHPCLLLHSRYVTSANKC